MDNKINNFKKSVEENGYNYEKNKDKINHIIEKLNKEIRVKNIIIGKMNKIIKDYLPYFSYIKIKEESIKEEFLKDKEEAYKIINNKGE